MYVLLKSLIAVAQERNQLVDITPEFPDILIQSFPDYLPQPFHKFSMLFEMCFSLRKISGQQVDGSDGFLYCGIV